MTNAKAIVDVEVNDQDFAKFVAAFKEWRARLDEVPGAWSKIGKATEAAGDSLQDQAKSTDEIVSNSADIAGHFADVTAALMAQAELHRKMDAEERKSEKARETAQKRYEASVAKTDRHYKDMRANITGSARGLASAAVDVLKWVGLGGIAGGLLGAGGLFGLDRLANSAGESRRGAQGLDTSVGSLKAFAVNYRRVVDPGSYLSNIETVARTPGLQYGIGGDIAQMSANGMDTADIGASLIPKIKAAFQQYGANSYGLHASGLDNIVSLQEAIRISKLSGSEISEIGGKYGRSKSQLGLSDQVAKDWQDLSVQLDNAGEKIENVLIKDLDKLAPVLNHLSDKAVDLVDKLANKAVPAVDHFASYLDSPDFQKDLKDGEEAVKAFADGAIEAARVLGLIDRPAPDTKKVSNTEITQWNLRHPDKLVRYHDTPWDPDPSKSDPFSGIIQWWTGRDPYEGQRSQGNGGTPWESGSISSQLLDAIEKEESGGNPRAVSSKGAMGLFQLMPDTAKQYGVTDPFDPAQSRRAASQFLEDLMKRFGGDQRKTLAAYSWGPGNLERDISKWGDAWDQHLPSETTNYLRKLGSFGAPQQVHIVVSNQTGGSAVVSTNQLAQ